MPGSTGAEGPNTGIEGIQPPPAGGEAIQTQDVRSLEAEASGAFAAAPLEAGLDDPGATTTKLAEGVDAPADQGNATTKAEDTAEDGTGDNTNNQAESQGSQSDETNTDGAEDQDQDTPEDEDATVPGEFPKEYKNLKGRVKAGTATAEQYARYQQLRQQRKTLGDRAKSFYDDKIKAPHDRVVEQSRENRRQKEEQKQQEQKQEDTNYQEFLDRQDERRTEAEQQNSENEGLTEEQKLEKFKNEMNSLGDDLHRKITTGEDFTAEDIKRLRDLNQLKMDIDTGFTSEQTKQALTEAITGGKPILQEWFRSRNKEAQDGIQELLKIEFQVASMPERLKDLRTHRTKLQEEADQIHKDAENADGKERISMKTKEYDTYMKIANINTTIMNMKYGVIILESKRQDLEQFVRRKTGVTSGLGAAWEFTKAKGSRAVAEVQYAAMEASEYVFGAENRTTR